MVAVSRSRRGAYGRLDYPWFHEFGIYSGAMLPVALVWVWMRRRALPERRTLIAAATRVRRTHAGARARDDTAGSPGCWPTCRCSESLRAPARYIVLMQFALAILAAVAIEDLLAIVDGQ